MILLWFLNGIEKCLFIKSCDFVRIGELADRVGFEPTIPRLKGECLANLATDRVRVIYRRVRRDRRASLGIIAAVSGCIHNPLRPLRPPRFKFPENGCGGRS